MNADEVAVIWSVVMLTVLVVVCSSAECGPWVADGGYARLLDLWSTSLGLTCVLEV